MPGKRDLVSRGSTESSPLGTSLFVGLRVLDPFLQRQILLSAPLTSLALKFGLAPPLPPPSGAGLITTWGLGLTPFQTVVWTMSVGSAAKQIYWRLVTANEPMHAPLAITVSIFNTINNSLNSALFTIAASNPTYVSPYSLYIGAALYGIGILIEPLAETQRKLFKNDPANKGRPYAGGLFGLARNINYGAYALWRTGYAMAAGGFVFGAVAGAFFCFDFATRAIPLMEDYCQKRYGDEWKRIEKDVPFRLFPGVY